MTRLEQLRTEDLDEEQAAAWELVRQSWGADADDAGRGLGGPFSAVVRAPELVPRFLDLGRTLRTPKAVPARAVGLIILTVGTHWKADYEWFMHVERARQQGLGEAVIEAIGAGRVPEFDDEADRAVYSVARQLLEVGRVDDATYRSAQERFGDRGVVEIVALCGYYTLVAFILNAFEVPLPEGAERRWS